MIKSTEKYVSLKLYQFLSRWVYNIRENFLVKCQIGKSLEDLLQGRLVSRILRNLMFLFQFLGKLEEETNWLVLPIHSEAHVVAILLDDFNFGECLAKLLHKAEQRLLREILKCEFGKPVQLCVLIILLLLWIVDSEDAFNHWRWCSRSLKNSDCFFPGVWALLCSFWNYLWLWNIDSSCVSGVFLN